MRKILCIGAEGHGQGRSRSVGTGSAPGAIVPRTHRVLIRRASSILAAAALATLCGCSPYALLDMTVPREGYALHSALAYGEHMRQRLDVYTPDGVANPARVVIFFYGGSWQQGDRADYRFAGQALASRGFVAVVADYRLYPEVVFPAFMRDAAKAVRWVRENIQRYGGDPDRLYLMGHSAGAHIAALLALDRRYLEAVEVPRGSLRGTIGLAGPYAFSPLDFDSVRPVFVNAQDPEDTRPIRFVDRTDPPLLLLHGTDDDTVYPKNSILLAQRARRLGLDVQHVAYEDLGHVGIILAMAAPFRGSAPVLDDVAAFIDAR